MRYDLVLEVMSSRIFAKYDIAPKAQFSPEHFETCSMQYGYRTLQIVYLRFVISLTSGQVNFVAIRSQWGKNQVPQILIRSLQIAQNDDEYG